MIRCCLVKQLLRLHFLGCLLITSYFFLHIELNKNHYFILSQKLISSRSDATRLLIRNRREQEFQHSSILRIRTRTYDDGRSSEHSTWRFSISINEGSRTTDDRQRERGCGWASGRIVWLLSDCLLLVMGDCTRGEGRIFHLQTCRVLSSYLSLCMPTRLIAADNWKPYLIQVFQIQPLLFYWNVQLLRDMFVRLGKKKE